IAFLGKEFDRDLEKREIMVIGIIFGLTCLLFGGLKITTIFIVEIMIVSLLMLISFFIGGNLAGIMPVLMYGLYILGNGFMFSELSVALYMYLIGSFIGCATVLEISSIQAKKVRWFNLLKVIVVLLCCSLLVVGRYMDIICILIVFVPIAASLYYLVAYLETVNLVFKQHVIHANHDFLTGLGNVRTLDVKLKYLMENAKKHNQELSTLMLDLDYFKKINDTYGHEAGDIVLQELATIFKSCCRTTDILIRKGGEEFCILLPNCDSETAQKIGERIRKEVKYHPFLLPSGKLISVTISIGVSTLINEVENPNDLINFADEALYKAKKQGRDQVVVYQIQTNL
ncbi:MAG TPA: hypothetical protein DCY20_01260, partial [Firmicutes bacterium]|nr:hypothetical protein [Bacillota bacterium]